MKNSDKCPKCESKKITVDEKEDYNRFDHEDGEFTRYYIQWDCKDCGAKGNHVYSMKLAKITVEK